MFLFYFHIFCFVLIYIGSFDLVVIFPVWVLFLYTYYIWGLLFSSSPTNFQL